MSGPKLSKAELEQRRREALERARQEALRRLREAQTTYRDTCAKVYSAQQYLNSQINQIDVLYKGEAGKTLNRLLAMLKTIPVMDDKDTEEYLAAIQAMNQAIDYATAQAAPVLDKYLSITKQDQKLRSANSAHQSFQAYLSNTSDPVDIKSMDFSSHYDQQQLNARLMQVIQHYQWLTQNGTSKSLKQFAAASVAKLQKLQKDSHALSQTDKAKSLIQAIINEEAELLRVQKEFEDLYDSYTALATMMNTVPDPPSSFAHTDALKKEISRLDRLYRQKDEMDYIADQVNDVMINLGYGFVTSQVLTRKDQSEMDFSLYQADDRTGVAVYTDQSGAIMMRMTVLGDNADITDEDRDFSFQRQIDFCSAHPDIVNALAERGVYLTQEDYKEPDPKYTYKFAGDSQTTAVTKDADGRTVLKQTKIDRRKRRRADKKKMRAL